MSDTPHIADGETRFKVVNVTPDFCEVDGQVVPFEIYRDLSHELSGYAKKVRARGAPLLRVTSMVAGVVGNMGEGVLSGVSGADGHTLITDGSETVWVEGKAACRDGDPCLMNGKVPR